MASGMLQRGYSVRALVRNSGKAEEVLGRQPKLQARPPPCHSSALVLRSSACMCRPLGGARPCAVHIRMCTLHARQTDEGLCARWMTHLLSAG